MAAKAGYERFDQEEIERAHTSKASNSEMETNVLAGSLSGSTELLIDIEKLQESFEPAKKCCIFRVPRDLRKINEEAYTPQVVAIGPLHHGKEEYLIEMEKQKLRYVEKFGERTSMDKLMELRSFIEANEGKIHSFYAEHSNLSSDKFFTLQQYDDVFIIELLLRNDQLRVTREFDSLFDTPIRKAAIKLDLQLLENQLPYFVLEELFVKLDVVKPRGGEHCNNPLLILVSRFFFDCEMDHFTYDTVNIQHFTDLRRRFLLKRFSPPRNIQSEHIRDLPRATKLHESGVEFEKGKEDQSPLEISYNYISPSLLRIIPLFDGIECLIRNVMAFEQLHYSWETHLCNYILLMGFLIANEKDVDILMDKGIIFNCLGDDNATIANMFNKLGLKVAPSYSSYYNVAEELKVHNRKRWNHAKATLKRNGCWIGTGTVVTALLLLLTLVQTLCSVLQVRYVK
ncbi:hypothetical protein ACOSQ2_003738 [Xanthoceras sorbifolium]